MKDIYKFWTIRLKLEHYVDIFQFRSYISMVVVTFTCISHWELIVQNESPFTCRYIIATTWFLYISLGMKIYQVCLKKITRPENIYKHVIYTTINNNYGSSGLLQQNSSVDSSYRAFFLNMFLFWQFCG